MTEVETGSHQQLQRFQPLVGSRPLAKVSRIAASLGSRLVGRTIWNINSTPAGGGVAEMLQSLLPYVCGVGIDTRWAVIQGTQDFFHITKRLHHALHGSPGDGTPLDDEARAIYDAAMRQNVAGVTRAVRPHDIVILHDPQTAGLAPHLIDAGALVIWRCHIGHNTTDPEVERGWAFLAPYLREVPAFVFSRAAYVPDYCDHGKSVIITPSIDAFSPNNQEMSENSVRTILVHTGLVEGPPPADADHTFARDDGSPGRVERRADIIRLGRAPRWDTPLVVQISRWDPLKDMLGVMEGFTRLVDGSCPAGAELVLAGPNVQGVTDDPEGAVVFAAVEEAWRALPDALRNRIHLVCLPTDDVQENATIVNALQRHATVVVQKSLREGFGLTVTEALWKGRPVVASAVGGIQDQIEDGVSGMLLKDPRDLDAFAEILRQLLTDPQHRERLGRAARDRVRDHFLGIDHLLKYAQLIERIDGR